MLRARNLGKSDGTRKGFFVLSDGSVAGPSLCNDSPDVNRLKGLFVAFSDREPVSAWPENAPWRPPRA
jgi:hypothetical protein